MSDRFQFDVFLSHNSKDKPRVRKLAEKLKEAGLRVWLDEWIINNEWHRPPMTNSCTGITTPQSQIQQWRRSHSTRAFCHSPASVKCATPEFTKPFISLRRLHVTYYPQETFLRFAFDDFILVQIDFVQ